MTEQDRQRFTQELAQIYERVEYLADELDPNRTFSHSEETTREVVFALDTIAKFARRGMSYLRVSA